MNGSKAKQSPARTPYIAATSAGFATSNPGFVVSMNDWGGVSPPSWVKLFVLDDDENSSA